jgi:hypothetical protein
LKSQISNLKSQISNSPWSLLGNTAQRLLNEPLGLVEHYEARGNGVEVTWVLNQRPPGAGTLTVEAELTGLTFAARTKDGLHFADASGTARVRVGNVKAVDAAGRQWNLAMDVDGARLRVAVPGDILSAASFPLAIDPYVSPEFGIGVSIIVESGGGAPASAPKLASNGSLILVVWGEGAVGVYGARVDANGTVLDSNGISIGDLDLQAPLAVASDGTDYLVVGSCQRMHFEVRIPSIYVRGVLVQGSSGVSSPSFELDAFDPVAAQTKHIDALTACWNGSFMVFWCAGTSYACPNGYDCMRDDDEIFGARITIGMGTVQIVQEYYWGGLDPAATAAGGVCFVAYLGSSGEVKCRGFAADGSQQFDTVVTPNGGSRPGIGAVNFYAPIGNEHALIVWNQLGNFNLDLAAATVDTDGTLSHTPHWLSIPPGGRAFNPAVAARIAQVNPLIVWEDTRSSDGQRIYGGRLNPTTLTLDPPGGFPINAAGQVADTPAAAAFDQSGDTLVVWKNQREPKAPSEILGAWVPANGGNAPREVGGFVVGQAIMKPVDQNAPEIACNGQNWLVVWTGAQGEIAGTRVSEFGAVLDPKGITICGQASHAFWPAVAAQASGGDYLVAWTDLRNAETQGADIYGARIGALSGGVLDAEASALPICTAGQDQFRPRLASDMQGNYLVTWLDNREPPTRPGDVLIYGTPVSAQTGVRLVRRR